MSYLALGGGGLAGSNAVRFAYLDETGTGTQDANGYIVVAGVLVNADTQWTLVERELRELMSKFYPDDDEKCFHAKDLYHGAKNFHRDRFCQERRWDTLSYLCSLPEKHDLPVVFGHIRRGELTDKYPNQGADDINTIARCICAGTCTLMIERYMRECAPHNEVATLVYENTERGKAILRGVHNYMRKLKHPEDELVFDHEGLIPVKRIVDTAHFADKKDTSILQIADACAFAIRRKLENAKDHERFFPQVHRKLIAQPASWVSCLGQSS